MFNYTKKFFKDSKSEFRALAAMWFPLFIYQTVIRFFFISIFWLLYQFFVYWILRNPGEDYIFVTGLATLNFVHIDRLIIVMIFSVILFLLPLFIETLGVTSLSRQYYLGKKISLRTAIKESIQYANINFKIQILKYLYVLSNIAILGLILYIIFIVTPNIFGFILAAFFVLQQAFIIINKMIDYTDIGQRVFENKKNIFEIYNYSISKNRKKQIFIYYLFKTFFIVITSVGLLFFWLFITKIISKLSINHDVVASIFLGINSAIFIIVATIFSYLSISFFTLRSTRVYLEMTEKKSRKFQAYGRKKLSDLTHWGVLGFVVFSGFQGLFFYDYFHTNIIGEKDITVFAHRASMIKDTNNSLEALEYCIDKKIEFVEIDVQLSKEGIPVVFHDYTYFDGKQKKYIHNTPLAELAQFDLKVQKNTKKPPQQKIPTLEEFLLNAKGKIKVNIEIKTTKNFETELAEKTAEIIKKLDMQDVVLVTSFDYNILQKIEEIIPNIKTGLLIAAYIGELDEIADMNVDWLMINDVYYRLYRDEFDNFVDKKLALWSFSSGFDGTDALYYEYIQGVIVDNPEKLTQDIREYHALSIGERYYRHIEHIFLGG